MSEKTIKLEVGAQGVATVTLNRPDVCNALNAQMIEELTQVFTDLGGNSDVRIILMKAEGRLFCTGADLNWMREAANFTMNENIEDAKKLSALLEAIDKCPKPTIALVDGGVYGGGVGLVAACDIAIGDENTFFCLSEVKLGLIPAVISPYLVNAIGQRQARRYVITSERINCDDALRHGLIHMRVGEGEMEAMAETMVTHILKGSPEAIRDAKELIRFVESRPIDDFVRDEVAKRIAEARASDHGVEGTQAFLNKRLPSWVDQKDEVA